jgi:molecular chaperone DnaK (HSP70)
LELTRAKFEELNKKDFDKLIPVVDVCLKDAQKSKKDVDVVCLVGGSTRIPAVTKILENWIGDRNKLDKSLNPDESIAMGAAYLAASIMKLSNQTTLIDVIPMSRGVELEKKKFS